MSKIIFLDIDGVLNHQKSIEEYNGIADAETIKELIDSGGNLIQDDLMFDCNSMILLKKILNEYFPKLVIISSWNLWMSIDDYVKMFKVYNINVEGNLIGLTNVDTFHWKKPCRGSEIDLWRLAYDLQSDYIIIDDFYEFLKSQHNNVLLVDENGFNLDAYEKVKEFIQTP